MPVFEYKCAKCGKISSILLKNSDESGIKCPDCGSKKLAKQMSSFAGVVKEPASSRGGCGGCARAEGCPNAR